MADEINYAGTLRITNPATLQKWKDNGAYKKLIDEGYIYAECCGRFSKDICTCSKCRKLPLPPPDELDKEAKENGMDELKIYRFEALHIEDTFRIVANILKSRSKETCIDRQVCKSIEMINEILNKR